jgi:hypothetical protein
MNKPIGCVLKWKDGTFSDQTFKTKTHCEDFKLYHGVTEGDPVAIYTEQPPEPLSIRDEAELRILAGLCANSAYIDHVPNYLNDLASDAKHLADRWMKARTDDNLP